MTSIHRYSPERRKECVEAFHEDPQSLLRLSEEEAEQLHTKLTSFYTTHLEETGLAGYVVGLSGGVDSTLTAHLLVDAVGSERVYGLILPGAHSDRDHVDDALKTAERLEISTNDPEEFRKNIGAVVDTLELLGESETTDSQRLKRGNILARCRMIVLRDTAKARDALVAGTTNASERDMGYMTLAADGLGGVDNEAMYELYKTSVRDLARFVGVEESIIEKQPTADLWEGQTDEGELGYKYEVVDKVLAGLALNLELKEIAENVDGVDTNDVNRICERKREMKFKRSLPPHPSFS